MASIADRIRLLLTCALTAAALTLSLAAQDAAVDRAVADADALLQRGNIEVRGDVEILWRAVDALVARGEHEKALHYLDKGLRAEPVNLERMTMAAELYRKLGKHAEAEQMLQIYARNMEDPAIVQQAHEMLGQPLDLSMEDVREPELPTFFFCIVPLDEDVNILLLKEVAVELQEHYGLEAVVRKTEVKFPECRRDRRCQFIPGFLPKIAPHDPLLLKHLQKLNLYDSDDLDTASVLIHDFLRKQDGPESARQFDRLMKGMGRQYLAGELKEQFLVPLRVHIRNIEYSPYIGITSRDIFTQNTNYILSEGMRNNSYCVISYYRLLAEFNDERPQRPRLRGRIRKLVAFNLAHFYGMSYCKDPSCPMSYCNSVQELDDKEDWPCPSCETRIRDEFARRVQIAQSRRPPEKRTMELDPSLLPEGVAGQVQARGRQTMLIRLSRWGLIGLAAGCLIGAFAVGMVRRSRRNRRLRQQPSGTVRRRPSPLQDNPYLSRPRASTPPQPPSTATEESSPTLPSTERPMQDPARQSDPTETRNKGFDWTS